MRSIINGDLKINLVKIIDSKIKDGSIRLGVSFRKNYESIDIYELSDPTNALYASIYFRERTRTTYSNKHVLKSKHHFFTKEEIAGAKRCIKFSKI